MTITPINLPDDFGKNGPRDAAICRWVFDYNNGKLFWRIRAASNVSIGLEAGSVGQLGYRKLCMSNKCVMAHKAVWLMHNDRWPTDEIDHINGKRSDNRIENLREVSRKENMRNVKITSRNTSGTPGVHWNKRASKWQARIGIDGVWRNLGLFANLEDAVLTRRAAEVLYGFHENHGKR